MRGPGGNCLRVYLDRNATSIPLLVMLGVQYDKQKVLLATRNISGESESTWRGTLDGLFARGLRTPELLSIDGAADLERASAERWPNVPVQRCHGAQASQPCRNPCFGTGPRARRPV